eukprot:3836816-Karenia_brevis.AAC.1
MDDALSAPADGGAVELQLRKLECGWSALRPGLITWKMTLAQIVFSHHLILRSAGCYTFPMQEW